MGHGMLSRMGNQQVEFSRVSENSPKEREEGRKLQQGPEAHAEKFRHEAIASRKHRVQDY